MSTKAAFILGASAVLAALILSPALWHDVSPPEPTVDVPPRYAFS
jgi:hypothetical protein